MELKQTVTELTLLTLKQVLPLNWEGVDCSAEIGATPWENTFYGASGFAVTNIAFKGTKEIKVTDSFTLPVFAKAIWNPCSDKAYFTFGMTF